MPSKTTYKRVKAWAVLKGGYPIPPGWGTGTVWITKTRWQAVDMIKDNQMDAFSKSEIVPCTITYALPTKPLKDKRK